MTVNANVSQFRDPADVALGRLKDLNTDERMLVGLYYYEALTLDEIGTVLDQEPSEVQQRLDTVVAKLNGETTAVTEAATGPYVRAHG